MPCTFSRCSLANLLPQTQGNILGATHDSFIGSLATSIRWPHHESRNSCLSERR